MKPITLLYPVTVHGQEFKQLTLRRMKVADALRDYGEDKAISEMRMFADLCDVSPDVITELDMVDYESIQNAFLEMRKKPSTRQTSAEQR